MDFKMDDDFEESASSNQVDPKMKIIIISIVSIVIGLTVFFIVNHFVGRKETVTPPPEQEDVSLTDENVQILYQYVTYGTKGYRNDKFVREKMVNLSSFSEEDKYYYALEFADSDDFEFTGEYTEEKKKIYSFSISRLNEYMQRFFGPEVSFSTSGEYTHAFNFTINGQNVGHLTYSSEEDEYHVYFDGYQNLETGEFTESADLSKDEDDSSSKEVEIDAETGEETETDSKVNVDIVPYYGKLISATKLKDSTLILKEKVVYAKLEDKGGNYSIYITRDFDHNNLIETKPNLSKADVLSFYLDVNNYMDSASTITYTFKVDNNIYYFSNSEITE